jgi:hypothetical protein
MMYAEGYSILYWFRNGQLVSAFTNLMSVPPGVTQPGDKWWFQITPITLSYIWGEPSASPVVTVLGVPEVLSVTPDQGLTVGGDTVVIRGKNLTNPLAVRFGDVPASNIVAVSDTEISAVTPMHAIGSVSVVVETPGGVGRKPDAFTYAGDIADETTDEKKDKPACGCGSINANPRNGGGNIALLLTALCLLLLASYAADKTRTSNS